MTAIVPAALLADPTWLAHRYDPTGDMIHFVPADRTTRDRATFLTDEHLPQASQPMVIDRRAAVLASTKVSRLHFIFHSAYCCSTLLARVLDRPAVASTLKEPVILNDLVGWRHRGGDPKRLAVVLDNALTLLARPFETSEAVVVKPSNVVNGLASAMLAMRSEARAVLLYAPLRVYLTSIARKGMWGRLWVRDLLVKQIADGLIDLGFEQADYLRLTDLQAAAVGWLAQIDLFGRIASQFPHRARTLDSEVLITRSRDSLAAISAFYDLPLTMDQIDAMVVSDAFTRNAKDGSHYTATNRSREQEEGALLHADEIAKVVAWAHAVADNAGVAITPTAHALIG